MLVRLLRDRLRPYRRWLLGHRRAAAAGHDGGAVPAEPERRHHRQRRLARATPATSCAPAAGCCRSASCQIACSVVAVYFGARTAMSFGRDVRGALFRPGRQLLRARGRAVRRAVADHPHHQRRAAGADARRDDLHDDGRRADHGRRRHHHGAARGPRAVLAARGQRAAAGAC